jgi:hypothetical protein
MNKRYLALCICLFLQSGILAQQNAIVDSLKKKLAVAVTNEDKVELTGRLSQLLMAIDPVQSDEYGKKVIEVAELSRDRKLMIKAYMFNGQRYSYIAAVKGNGERSVSFYQQAYQIAKENNLDKELVGSLLALAAIHRTMSQADQAMNFTNQAFSTVTTIDNDSLKAECYNSFGDNYILKGEKLLALRNYFGAQSIAEIKKNPSLLRTCYTNLSRFYASVDNIDKALDYGVKAKDKLKEITSESGKYSMVNDLNYIGSLYVEKKNYDIARHLYEQAIRLADTLHFETLKIPSYISLLNLYLHSDEPQKAKEYFDKSDDLKTFLKRFGIGYVVDQAYAVIYMQLNRNDSARYYFDRAYPFFEKQSNLTASASFFEQLVKFNYKIKDYKKAEEYSLRLKSIGETMGDLDWQEAACKNLDSIYQQTSDYKQASFYGGKYTQFKDSVDKLGKEKDLLQLQIEDEQQRQVRIAKEEEEKLIKRHNIQYMAITIGIAVVFLILVLMGAFRVSIETIRVLNFFAFIFLFEFIILIADNQVHQWTHGEPWKVLAIKIVLIALLLPLHHTLEHRLVHYLASHKMIRLKEKSGMWWRRISGKETGSAHKV